jgi:hypothetical protein
MIHTAVILPISSRSRKALLHQAYAAGNGALPEHIRISDGQVRYFWNNGVMSVKPCVIVDVQFKKEA